MEKLILEQLEEEERAKELAAELQQAKNVEHLLTAPPRLAEPPKEKPPPPPICSNEIQKPNSLKRVNSTKRIKKEIHKRRSNFLGIENTDENIVCDASSVPPPLALEEILKAEMELDRESRRRLESATAERLTLEESEMMRREREIIESLESEERRRMLYSIYSEAPNMHHEDVSCEDDRIHDLQEERKRLEEDHLFTKEKQLILERAEYIKKQEEPDLSAPLLSATTHFPPPLSSDTLESAPPGGGDGNPALSDIVPICAPDRETAKEAPPVKPKPIPPPKPLKKKEVIRKERERLRQEQEELQREKEEHRRKQEELLRSQKSHAGPDCLIANGPMRPVSARIKSPQNDTWGQQKVPSARKQTTPDPSLSEIRYNQNHWLIQEAEMRRIAEQKERSRRIIQQQQQQVEDPRAHHPTEDGDVPRVAVPPPPALYPVQKYPPVLGSDKPLVYSRRNVVPQTPPAKPSRQQEHVLSVSGRKRCSHCGEELGRGAAMIIESLQLYYHIHCFRCCVCQARLGNGSCGADVRVRSNKLHCHNCYSNDEAGLKFSQV